MVWLGTVLLSFDRVEFINERVRWVDQSFDAAILQKRHVEIDQQAQWCEGIEACSGKERHGDRQCNSPSTEVIVHFRP